MQQLPPVGWPDVATKRDLDALETSIRAEIQTGLADSRNELHIELAAVRAEHRADLRDLRTEMRAYVLATLSAMVAISGTMVAAIKL